ncbi:hypothetical protein BC962_0225 [Gillisia mitskevichiae]|uniref:DUF3575 domain-containing protein n=1 Tax=Gillisia mitskevichiae TaxID=270921 RepID=A0A495PXY6_9FLAO|nr:hypothetical protein [Gillisia mitskevichiae]RKS55266.1 hypothetical protein BC962_0225 [Gillisia mitskevichiae]
MTKNNLLLIFTFVFISFTSIAQETTSGIEGMRKNAISFNILGTTPLIGITYDRVVSENISLELGVGIPSVGAGFKYYPSGIKVSKMLFHVGLTGTIISAKALDIWGTSEDDGLLVAYLPIGVSYFGEKGFNLGVDLGPAMAKTFAPWGNVKVGYRF